jgi:Mn2+/Fe2+ NRAMP family transporter
LITQRLFLLSILFGLSFGILILYVNDLYGVLIAVLLITAIVFAATRDDLKEMGRTKILVVLMALIALFTYALSFSELGSLGGYLFESLTVVDFGMLLGYIVLSRMRTLER